MSNKTCGECKYRYAYPNDEDCNGRCKLFPVYRIPSNKPSCSKFKPIPPPTNGDVIRQMSNEELAELIVPKVMFCDGCPVRCEEKDIPQIKDNPFGADIIDDVCKKRVEAWLNAPAESDVCVAQNAKNYTQADLCKADYTQDQEAKENA